MCSILNKNKLIVINILRLYFRPAAQLASGSTRFAIDYLAMEVFRKSFRRNGDGSWTCIQPATYAGPQGQIQVNAGATFRPNERFMNLDLVTLLEQGRHNNAESPPPRFLREGAP